jgi:hypothetical protein
MPSQIYLSEAATTLAAAHALLLERGYALSNVASDEGVHVLVKAEKAGRCFLGENPLTLLGLIHLYEVLGEDWPPTAEQRAAFFRFFYT